MIGYRSGPTVIRRAVLGSGAVCGNLFASRKPDFLAVARNSQRIVELSKEISGSVDEMLVTIPAAWAASVSNAFDVPVRYLSQEQLSPFGDWWMRSLANFKR